MSGWEKGVSALAPDTRSRLRATSSRLSCPFPLRCSPRLPSGDYTYCTVLLFASVFGYGLSAICRRRGRWRLSRHAGMLATGMSEFYKARPCVMPECKQTLLRSPLVPPPSGPALGDSCRLREQRNTPSSYTASTEVDAVSMEVPTCISSGTC